MLRRARDWLAERGTTIERVISDNGSAYKSRLRVDTGGELGITPKWTRLYRPQTNGKSGRFHRPMADGWTYAKHYLSESERRQALGRWIHDSNHHRLHSACGSHRSAG